MLNPLDWIKSYSLYLFLAFAAIGWAGYGVQNFRLRGMKLEAAQAEAKAQKDSREKEQRLNDENGKVTDELLKDRATAIADAASSAKRLRDLSRASSEAASACRRLDDPAAGVLREDTREALEREAQRADQVTIQLTKLQDYVKRVCLP